MSTFRGWIWFDLENTPHALFLEPFIVGLRSRGVVARVTAKPQAQTLDVARARGIDVTPIGRGDFASDMGKVVGGVARAFALARWTRQFGRPATLVSSSRSASLAAWMLRLPAVGLMDYEHAHQAVLARGNDVVWMPDLLKLAKLGGALKRVARFYPGLKENLYLDEDGFDRAAERRRLEVGMGSYLVVARPPATFAHYASEASEMVWSRVVEVLEQRPDVTILVSPRNQAQKEALRQRLSGRSRVRVLDRTVPGAGLVAAADLVVSGGGTMNREATVLGVPAWSTFLGPPPTIDLQLEKERRLQWLRTTDEAEQAAQRELPRLSPRRGPFPEGRRMILEDILSRMSKELA